MGWDNVKESLALLMGRKGQSQIVSPEKSLLFTGHFSYPDDHTSFR